jgi:hypothetical protein
MVVYNLTLCSPSCEAALCSLWIMPVYHLRLFQTLFWEKPFLTPIFNYFINYPHGAQAFFRG